MPAWTSKALGHSSPRTRTQPDTTHASRITPHCSPLTIHHSPPTTQHSLLVTTRHSTLTTQHSPLDLTHATPHAPHLTPHASRLTPHRARLTAHHLPPTARHSTLNTHHSKLTPLLHVPPPTAHDSLPTTPRSRPTTYASCLMQSQLSPILPTAGMQSLGSSPGPQLGRQQGLGESAAQHRPSNAIIVQPGAGATRPVRSHPVGQRHVVEPESAHTLPGPHGTQGQGLLERA